MTAFKHFSEMDAWRVAKDIALAVHRLCGSASLCQEYWIINQARRSALSISCNIAEGFGRGGDCEFARFLDIARGSAAELSSLLILIGELVPELAEQTDIIARDVERVQVMIAKLTSYLRGRARESYDSYSTIAPSGRPDDRTTGRPDDL